RARATQHSRDGLAMLPRRREDRDATQLRQPVGGVLDPRHLHADEHQSDVRRGGPRIGRANSADHRRRCGRNTGTDSRRHWPRGRSGFCPTDSTGTFCREGAMHVRTYATMGALGCPFVACQAASRSVDTRPVGPGGPADSAVQRAGPELVPGQYIVVFHSAVTDPGTVATALVSGLGGTMLHIYTSAIKGFAARLPASAVGAIQRNPLVASVEPDQVMRADVTQAMDANGDPWGLDRIDQGALPLSRTYSYTSTGAGVHAYIIDTGIWTLHPEFGGRADDVYDALGITGEDCNGHGTHVAGTVGAATYGVAKGVSLHGVRVLSCAGIGLNSDVIAGVDWVTANHA